MLKFARIFRNITCNKVSITPQIKNIPVSFRGFSCYHVLQGKMHLELENQYAYALMENRGYTHSLDTSSISINNNLTAEQFHSILQEDYSKFIPQDLYTLFNKLGTYCTKENICITRKEFDNFIDHLTDNIKFAGDEELKQLFYSLNNWRETPSVRSRNYIEVWAALDEECIKRLGGFTFDQMLSFVSLFYMLNVSRFSDFSYRAIQKLASRSKQLTPAQLVQTLFFVGILRKSPHDIYLMELQVEKHFNMFTVDDLAIISMGFFKSKTLIRSPELLSKIIDKVIENSSTIHEVSLAALLKVLRYSLKLNNDEKLFDLLDTLQHEAQRLSVMCCIHLALCGTSTLTLHKQCLDQITKHVSPKLSKARLKDLERLALTFCMLNYKPANSEILFDSIIKELKNPERENEISHHGRSFACCLSFLAMLNICPVDLINKALEPKFLEKTYGKAAILYGREILHLHNLSQIYFEESVSNKLDQKQALLLAKKYTDFVPDKTYQKQYNVTEKMMLDVITALKEGRGDNYVLGQHILTHHQRGGMYHSTKI